MYAQMERADEPIEEGTPINKALFDSIKASLQEIEAKGLPIKKYNELSHYFETNSYVKTYTNSYIGEEGSVSISGDFSNGGRITSTASNSYCGAVGAGKYVIVNLDKPIIIKKLSYQDRTVSGTVNYRVEASLDNVNYDIIGNYSKTGEFSTRTIDLADNTKEYKYIKFTYESASSSGAGLYFNNFRIKEVYKTDKVKNICTSQITFEASEKQRFMTIIPAEYDATIPIVVKFDNIEIPINGSVTGGAKYELVYENETFSPIEINESINSEIANIKSAIVALGGSV